LKLEALLPATNDLNGIMSEINLVKIPNNYLAGSLPEDEEKLRKWAVGEILRANVNKPRNARFHRKFFALLNVAFDNQDKYSNLNDFRIEVELKCGNYQEHVTTKGQIIYLPKSISFAQMDELEFSNLYDKAIDVILKHFCIGSTAEEINQRVLEILNFS
jgi:hypothetical protein